MREKWHPAILRASIRKRLGEHHVFRGVAAGSNCVTLDVDIVSWLLDATEWQPIETAPKDGTEVLMAVKLRGGIPGKMLVGHWQPAGCCIEDHPPINDGWYFWNGHMFDVASKPTHWMPLPPLPLTSVTGRLQ